MSKHQTDNSYLHEKIKLRRDSLAIIDKDEISVLECFSGDGIIWSNVKKQTSKNIKILRIDKKTDKRGVLLVGDNVKFLKNIDVSVFDIVDLDAYGSPFKQLQILFDKNYKGVVHCTYIQSGMGIIDKKLLQNLGFTSSMIKKCPTLFSKNALDKFLYYLHKMGVYQIVGCFINRKNYFYFEIK